MADFAGRLASVREEVFGERGRSHFARALGIPLTSYLNYEKGRVPPMDIVVKIMALTRVNPRWLLRGEGCRYLPEGIELPPAEDAASLLADVLWENGRLRKELLAAKGAGQPAVLVVPARGDREEWLAEHEDMATVAGDYVPVPILAGEAAASPTENVCRADREGWMLCARSAVKHPKSTFGVRVLDDAMAPAIRAGSHVGVDCSVRDPSQIDESGSNLVAVRDLRRGCVIRQLHQAEKHWLFLPSSPSGKARRTVWAAGDEAECPLIGKVVFVFATL